MGTGQEKRITVDDKEYVLRGLDSTQVNEGQRVYNKAFKLALEENAILKKSLDDHMRRQGLWSDETEAEYNSLIKQIADLEFKIKSGTYKKASELRDKALNLATLRGKLSSLLSARNSMDSVTAEGQADQARFEYAVSVGVIDFLTNKPVFSSLQDYKNRESERLSIKLASEYADFAYGVDVNYHLNFVENKVLKRLGLINEDGELVDKKGRRVDSEGNLVDENGARIDEEGNRIDINNNPIIDDSALETLEFEDDLSEDPPSKKSRKKKDS